MSSHSKAVPPYCQVSMSVIHILSRCCMLGRGFADLARWQSSLVRDTASWQLMTRLSMQRVSESLRPCISLLA